MQVKESQVAGRTWFQMGGNGCFKSTTENWRSGFPLIPPLLDMPYPLRSAQPPLVGKSLSPFY